MTASARFDTSNKSNIFDELNKNTERKQGPSNARVVGLAAEDTTSAVSVAPSSKIEFDTKTAVASKTSIFSQDSLTAKADHVTKDKEKEDENISGNIYLQVIHNGFYV